VTRSQQPLADFGRTGAQHCIAAGVVDQVHLGIIEAKALVNELNHAGEEVFTLVEASRDLADFERQEQVAGTRPHALFQRSNQSA